MVVMVVMVVVVVVGRGGGRGGGAGGGAGAAGGGGGGGGGGGVHTGQVRHVYHWCIGENARSIYQDTKGMVAFAPQTVSGCVRCK